jgi:hypothetical protein
MATKILGRAWFYNDHVDIETFEYKLESMKLGRRTGAEWAREHLYECYKESELRELLEVPAEGNYQVIFKGEIDGAMCGYETQEWDEWFELGESICEPVPDDYVKILEEIHNHNNGVK